MSAIVKTDIQGFPCRRGKVRDVYDVGVLPGAKEAALIIITTDRISAFDKVLPTPIPRRGELLTKMSLFWFDHLAAENHLITADTEKMPEQFRKPELKDRTIMVRKLYPLPVECVARSYLCGSAYDAYTKNGEICGIDLPLGLQKNMPFPLPIFTPATKEETGHDINITIGDMQEHIANNLKMPNVDKELFGSQWFTAEVVKRTLDTYEEAIDYAWDRGIIIADTKFEFGVANNDGELVLIDEVLTPDSSRFWDVKDYCLGINPKSMDKQFIRDYLSAAGRTKPGTDPLELPDDVVQKTMEKYAEIYKRLTGQDF